MAVSTYTYLTDKDKLGIITSHIKNKEYALYNDELSKMSETFASIPNKLTMAEIDARILDSAAKLTGLKAEAKRLESAVAAEPVV